jgi:hypothetical protein
VGIRWENATQVRIAQEIDRAAHAGLSLFEDVLLAVLVVLREARDEVAPFRAAFAGGELFVALAGAAAIPMEVATRAKEVAALLWPEGVWDRAVVERVRAAMRPHTNALTPFLQGVISRGL